MWRGLRGPERGHLPASNVCLLSGHGRTSATAGVACLRHAATRTAWAILFWIIGFFRGLVIAYRIGQRNPVPARKLAGLPDRTGLLAQVRNTTLALHAGFEMDPAIRAISVRIYPTIAYGFTEHGAALFNLEVDGFRYSRISNSTNAVQRRAAAMEGAEEALAVGSGQAAIYYAVSNLAHRHGIPLVVDNTVATPMLCRPMLFGADMVVHTLTKFTGDHRTTLGGIIIDSGQFPWAAHPNRFPMFGDPDPSYQGLTNSEHFGPNVLVARCRSIYLRTTGAAASETIGLGIGIGHVDEIIAHLDQALDAARTRK